MNTRHWADDGECLAGISEHLLRVEDLGSVGDQDAAVCYRTIRESDLPIVCKTTLQEVFVSWLEQRLKYSGKKDMEMILLGELPELEETQCGRDLIQLNVACEAEQAPPFQAFGARTTWPYSSRFCMATISTRSTWGATRLACGLAS